LTYRNFVSVFSGAETRKLIQVFEKSRKLMIFRKKGRLLADRRHPRSGEETHRLPA
jgi:hypothetical protein